MNNNCQYRLIETEGCDAFDANDNLFDTTIKRNQWEYEQICKSLTNGNCDDVISILLADTRKLRRVKQKNANNDEPAIGLETRIDCESFDSEKSLDEVISNKLTGDHQSTIAINTLCSASISSSSTISSGDTCSNGNNNNSKTTSSSLSTVPSQNTLCSTKKPPILPNRCSAIYNLDKNRINLRRNRSRLLPRPISLPSSFNLLRNFRNGNTNGINVHPQHGDNDAKIDLEFIRQLEDDIYRTREEILAESKHRRSKVVSTLNENPYSHQLLQQHQQDNKNCDKCNASNENSIFQPNQIVERKLFDDQLSRFNERQHAVLLLDAWQLQPLLMKRETIEYSDFFHHDQCNRFDEKRENDKSKTRSILIIDNSAFYPVIMRYEIGQNGDMTLPADTFTRSDRIDDGRLACDCIENCEQTKRFTKLFQIRVQKLAAEMHNANKLNTSAINGSIDIKKSLDSNNGSSPAATGASVDNNATIKSNNERSTSSRFRRFFLQRNYLKSKHKQTKRIQMTTTFSTETATKSVKNGNNIVVESMPSPIVAEKTVGNNANAIQIKFKETKTTKSSTDGECTKTNDNSNYTTTHNNKIIWNESPIKNNNSNNWHDLNRNSTNDTVELMALRTKYMLQNTKLNWLLSTKPKIDAFKLRLHRRRHSVHYFSGEKPNSNRTIIKLNDLVNGNTLANRIAVMPSEYDSTFCQLFKSISWSCSDLIDINNADYFRRFYSTRNINKCCNENHVNNKLTEKNDRLASNTKINGIPHIHDSQSNEVINNNNNNSMVKSIKRRSSFRRIKRHSVGSATAMTDVVKAWVYRRRCLFRFSLSHFNLVQ